MIWKNRYFQFIILILLAVIWGSSFILMKYSLKSFSSQQAASIRIVLASFVLLPYSLKYIRDLQRNDLKFLLIAGFFGNFIPAFLFMKAETRIDSALAGMLNSLTPVFTLLIGIIFLKTKTSWLQILGIFLGLFGALGLISSGKNISLQNVNSYSFFIIIATICYAININTVKKRLTHLKGIQITSLSFLFIGPPALLYLAFTDFAPVLQAENRIVSLTALAVLGIVGTAFAMILMNSLIRYTSAVLASSVTYIIPVFAILWGILDGETITLWHIGFMFVVIAGVYLINRKF